MSTNPTPDVGPDGTRAGSDRTPRHSAVHPDETNAEELAADGLARPTQEDDDPTRSMADRIRAEGISEPDDL